MKSNKHFQNFLEIPDYYPSGYYSVSMLNAFDVANNISWVYMVKDTSNFYIKPSNKSNFKDIRDSIYIKTPFPDYVAPEVDVNNITITAQPTNPIAPDGETRVDISLLARDLSDFPGHEAGLNRIRYNLRDPLGVFHHYDSWNDNGLFDFYSIIPDGNSDWKVINLNVLLPKGSPPGKWGLSSIQTQDRAGNFRNYSFVEYVRFDVIPSDIVLTSPLQAEILNKVVNAGNADKIKVSMSCIPCKNKNYLYKVYSLMGGNVVNGNGVFGQDSIIKDLDLSGVIDGVIKLTVQVTDSINQLIATETTDYTKDTQLPKAFYLKTNLQNQGSSSLDDLIIDIVYEKVRYRGDDID